MNNRPLIIAPSILAADFARLGEEIVAMDKGGADWFHIDIMDGHFVPNLSFGFPVVASARKVTAKTFDTHLMVTQPQEFLDLCVQSGCDRITVHHETETHLHGTVEKIRSLGKKVGVAINPATPVSVLEHVIDRIDLILVMTVNPGFGGQGFITSMLDKVRQAKALVAGRAIDIEVDGGVGVQNAAAAHRAGANVLVAGSSLFKGSDYAANIKALRLAATTTSA